MADAASDLGALVDMQIRTGGPMSLATYMALCLTHPTRGYYRKADPLGAAGDFITAPEISQAFGEVIGAFIADLYAQMGAPPAFTLLELGPGRGTLMADALRVACRMPGLGAALDLRLYETNPDLVAMQRDRLAGYGPTWIETVEDIGPGPAIVIANEFFDALPIRQFVARDGQWYERCVGLVEGKRQFGLSPHPVPKPALPEEMPGAADGTVAEIGLAAVEFMHRLAAVLAPRGGAILAIDYGYARTQPGETLQAVARHRFIGPLEAPGESDLTAHVDFAALGRAARMAGLSNQALAAQGRFLTSLGILKRRDALVSANPSRADSLAGAVTRLVSPDQMGEMFKVFCAASPGLRPAGFA